MQLRIPILPRVTAKLWKKNGQKHSPLALINFSVKLKNRTILFRSIQGKNPLPFILNRTIDRQPRTHSVHRSLPRPSLMSNRWQWTLQGWCDWPSPSNPLPYICSVFTRFLNLKEFIIEKMIACLIKQDWNSRGYNFEGRWIPGDGHHRELIYNNINFNVFLILARPKGLEPLTYWLEVSCSIQLSYGRLEEKVL